MKIFASFILLLFSTVCFGQKTVVGRIYSIVTGQPAGYASIRLDNKQLIQVDTNGIFQIKTTKRTVRVSVVPENIYQLDTLLLVKSIADTVKLFVSYPIDSALAEYDIEHKQVKLFCGGGIAPLAPMPSDKVFENEYSVKYHMLDCLMPDINELNSYNKKIASYLDTKYGLDWRQTARPDIFGVTKKAYR